MEEAKKPHDMEF